MIDLLSLRSRVVAIAFNGGRIGEVQKCYILKLNKVLLLGFLYLFLRPG